MEIVAELEGQDVRGDVLTAVKKILPSRPFYMRTRLRWAFGVGIIAFGLLVALLRPPPSDTEWVKHVVINYPADSVACRLDGTCFVEIRGRVQVPNGAQDLYLIVEPLDSGQKWVENKLVLDKKGHWQVQAYFPSDAKGPFSVYLLSVKASLTPGTVLKENPKGAQISSPVTMNLDLGGHVR